MRLFKLAIIAASFAALSVAALVSRAVVARADDVCTLAPADFDTITAIQNDPSLTANQEVTQELTARKALLSQTIACAQTEVVSLQNTLTDATSTASTQDIQSQLLSDLDGASSFYTTELSKLNSAGIAGTKEIAQEVIAWRAGTYTSLEGEINNYLLWTQNQPLFTTAQTRMDQTQQAVSFLESAATDSKLQNDFNAAYASFQTAKQENIAAKNALAQNVAPSHSLALIKQSLDSLSNTYQGFFSVSDDIKTLLPQ